MNGVGVEAQLQDVPRLSLGAREFGVDGLVGREVSFVGLHAHEEVRDAADTTVYEGHLKDRVVGAVHWISHAGNPLVEGLVGIPPGHPVDRLALIL